ncbi:putative glycosyl [Erysiphe necator]|uniref:Putative glycosyl n=1 Tax=Uncinula necator TaxID=52586 RepID=A0A0B1P192_UNCNE|nr:putative glycosyl [Erysiphe necator]
MAETNPTIPSIEFIPWTEVQVNSATASDVTDYINERIHEYEDENLYGSELHGYFVADFQKFTGFSSKKNVFIQKSRGQSIPAALIDALLDQWCSMPDEMINEVLEKYRPINNLKALRNSKTFPNNPTSSHNPVITLMKAYTEEQKYAGTPSESFDLKYKIFTDFCNTIDIPINKRNGAFKVMLKDAALQHYHATFNSENPPDLSTLYQTIKSNFEGKEYQQSMLVKWNEMSLKTVLKDIESSDVEIALNTLITNLRQIQMSLSPEFQSDKFLFAKILQACRTYPSCSIACSTVMDDTVATLTNRLRSNISTWKSQQNFAIEQYIEHNDGEANIHFTDRRYKRNQRTERQRKICFVCRKEGCWSTRHSDSERNQARKRLTDAYTLNDPPYNRNNNRRFVAETNFDESTIDAFIQQYEGINPDNDRSLVYAFDTFLTIKQDSDNKTNYIINQFFHTQCGMLDFTLAQNTAQQINTGITRYPLTEQVENLEIDNDTFAISKPRFNSDVFYGILIDTGAAGKSTAGYKQFQAFSKPLAQHRLINQTK